MKNLKEKYGDWALVTGASSGIGEEFAHQLAAQGIHLVLVARRIDRLETLAKSLSSQYHITVKAVQADLSSDNFMEVITSATESLDIGILVNNAGMNCEGHFYRGTLDRNVQMMRLNMEAPFILTYHYLKGMTERKRGAILFTASTSSFSAHPYLSHYGATKAYILSLAESLNYEYKDSGIDVLALCPGPTESEMTSKVKGNPIMMKAAPVVSAALEGLGKTSSVIPGAFNKATVFANKYFFSRELGRNLNAAMLKKFLPGVKPKN